MYQINKINDIVSETMMHHERTMMYITLYLIDIIKMCICIFIIYKNVRKYLCVTGLKRKYKYI